MFTLGNVNTSTYLITVNCAINPDSTADVCEVIATASNHILIGSETLNSIKPTCMYCISLNESLGVDFLLCIVDLVLK